MKNTKPGRVATRKHALGEYRSLQREARDCRIDLLTLSRLFPSESRIEESENLRDRKRRLLESLTACRAGIRETEDFIAQIGDSELRRIFTLRYVEGKTWQQISFALGHYDESYPRKKHNRYLSTLTD